MLQQMSALVLSRVFGDGLGADLAGRGTVYLADEVRKALDHDEERLSTVRLRPGESYTVIARPPATRRERKLASRQRALSERDHKASVPTRRQLRAARKLARTQRRLDRTKVGRRRHRRLEAKEAARGERFDRLMRPTPRQAKLHAELAAVTSELDSARAESFSRARAHRSASRRRARVTVYD